MIRGCAWLFLCLVWSVAYPVQLASAADKSLVDIAQQLEIHERLQGEFQQRKKLHFMTTPLRSFGTFSLSAASGLSWNVTEPVRSQMQVVDGRVTLDGQVVQDRGVGQFMVTIMQAFMAGDLSAVEKDFSAQVSAVPQGWQLQLSPRSVLVRAVISEIILTGSSVLQTISILEKNGNQTRIELSNVSDNGPTAQVRDAGDG